MWIYSVENGTLHQSTGDELRFIGTGYSGNGKGLNNPSMEQVHEVGPLPRGLYFIGKFEDHHRVGKFAAPLVPEHSNEMFGRSEFFLHGDNKQGNCSASDGCIVLPRVIREQIARSDDYQLQVV